MVTHRILADIMRFAFDSIESKNATGQLLFTQGSCERMMPAGRKGVKLLSAPTTDFTQRPGRCRCRWAGKQLSPGKHTPTKSFRLGTSAFAAVFNCAMGFEMGECHPYL
jgi:hypothetical protein